MLPAGILREETFRDLLPSGTRIEETEESLQEKNGLVSVFGPLGLRPGLSKIEVPISSPFFLSVHIQTFMGVERYNEITSINLEGRNGKHGILLL
jgi:hypothetical protein